MSVTAVLAGIGSVSSVKSVGAARYSQVKSDANLPIVEINVELKASSENLNKTHVLPTPESPINSSLNK